MKTDCIVINSNKHPPIQQRLFIRINEVGPLFLNDNILINIIHYTLYKSILFSLYLFFIFGILNIFVKNVKQKKRL